MLHAKNEFDKMQIPLCVNGYTHFAKISLATIGVCVFVRLLRWAHFFILLKERRSNNEKNFVFNFSNGILLFVCFL